MTKPPPWSVPPSKPTEASRPPERIVPTDAERKNGWTEESLTAYVAERRAAQDAALDPTNRRPARPDRSAGHRWAFPATNAWTVQRRFTAGRRGR